MRYGLVFVFSYVIVIKTELRMLIISMFTWSKQRCLFWRAGFFPANQGFLKTFQIALIGCIKAGPRSCNRLFITLQPRKM